MASKLRLSMCVTGTWAAHKKTRAHNPIPYNESDRECEGQGNFNIEMLFVEKTKYMPLLIKI